MDEINALLERAAERGAVRGVTAVWDAAVSTLSYADAGATETEIDIVPLVADESPTTAGEHSVETRRRARRWLGIAAALVLLCGAGVLKLVVARRDADRASGRAGTTGRWPMRLVPGLVPFYEAGDVLPADLTGPHDEAGLASLRCMTWTLVRTSVLCSTLDDPGPDGILSAVSYRSANGQRSVDIFIKHRSIDAADYAHEISQGKDVGYEEPPLPQAPVAVRGTSGWLAEAGNDVRRIVWNEPNGLPVALEGHGLNVAELLAIADGLRPGDLGSRAVPVVLADSGAQPDGRRVLASEFISDGTPCLLFEPERVCVARPADQPVLVSSSVGGAFAGITDGRAVAVGSADGTSRHAGIAYPALGVTAFAFVDDTITSLDAFDAAGNSLGQQGSSPLTIDGGGPTTALTSMPPTSSTTVGK